VEIIYGEGFKRQLKRLSRRYRQIKKDLKPVIDALQNDETPGDQIPRTDHVLYKVRAKNSDANRGKSGGYRVIYYLKTNTRCTLVTIYSKSDQEDIDPDVLDRLISEITRTEDSK